MTEEELLQVYEASIRALQSHAKDQSMDDAEYIRVIRVLIETAETLLTEIEESEEKIATAVWKLTEFGKNLYVNYCLQQNSEIANKEDFDEESGELFDYVFFHGTYPE